MWPSDNSRESSPSYCRFVQVFCRLGVRPCPQESSQTRAIVHTGRCRVLRIGNKPGPRVSGIYLSFFSRSPISNLVFHPWNDRERYVERVSCSNFIRGIALGKVVTSEGLTEFVQSGKFTQVTNHKPGAAPPLETVKAAPTLDVK